ncbi:NAD(P)H-dependent glycerol-3-phosphate dehydrogenase [Parahalioglobus pacificus]|uniref:Glycerol-3-phosphate dehydrogenase [NAD(P)+] n=1 Tax=Parahalioglobus pacificus TaxID=930806 RepID=A0A919CIL1_9GAMM|nr:NAD(P)H-dependent glycerol-3-phosphate dehydrogenase [Halioglobus pacificus]GHD29122.1 glycerol-3-phosphate dehydrogenase [NAD(P)+] [Halioglobus pacificus]
MPERHRVAVLGGGSFGTVIANTMACNGNQVALWLRNPALAASINERRENDEYLPGYTIDERVTATLDLSDALNGIDTVFVAVPSASFRTVVKDVAVQIGPSVVVVSLTKGIEPGGFHLMSEVLAQELPHNPRAVVSGPNLAREIAAGQLSACVSASPDSAVNASIHDLLHSDSFLVYSSSDVYGVELGGALKNIYAILSGLCHARDFGENTIGMVLTRALAEMSRFAVELGANPLTFLGLSGVGDLIVTCSTPLSRNYRVGYGLGKGQPLAEVLAGMDQVAEGINTLGLVKAEADRRGVPMPLVNGLYGILYEHRPVSEVFSDIMFTEVARDVEFVAS